MTEYVGNEDLDEISLLCFQNLFEIKWYLDIYIKYVSTVNDLTCILCKHGWDYVGRWQHTQN